MKLKNKYQISLDHIKNGGSFQDLEDDIKNLERLVKKTIEREVKFESDETDTIAFCPNCNEELDFEYEYDYCPHCAQALHYPDLEDAYSEDDC